MIIFTFFKLPLKETIKKAISNGQLQSEGWLNQNQKVDYWFYYENGNKKKKVITSNKNASGGFFTNQIKNQ
jgi:hypothetical protein